MLCNSSASARFQPLKRRGPRHDPPVEMTAPTTFYVLLTGNDLAAMVKCHARHLNEQSTLCVLQICSTRVLHSSAYGNMQFAVRPLNGGNGTWL